jgi:hypothetical protein
VKRKILAFNQDNEGYWVAQLECGHCRHVRHNPPWINREWVLTESGRDAMIGQSLDCKLCDTIHQDD